MLLIPSGLLTLLVINSKIVPAELSCKDALESSPATLKEVVLGIDFTS